MTATTPRPLARVPAFIRLSNGLSRRLLRANMPMGPNVLMTIRGRTTGEPRSAAVAIAEIDGHRYVIGAYGDVNWVKNLRAAGEADIKIHGHIEKFRARELDHAAALTFFDSTLPTYIAHFPRLGRGFARVLFGSVAPEIFNDHALAATTRPVFELLSA